MGSLADRLSSDLKDAMRSGDTVRRDEIRGVLAALKAERQTKLTRDLEAHGLIVHGDDAQAQLSAAAQQGEIARVQAEAELTDAEEQAVVQQRAKQHRQSIEGFERGRRLDLVTIEQNQLMVLENYLPRQIDGSELDAAVSAAISQAGAQGPRDMAKVMPLLSQQLRGRADMKQVSARVQALLAGNTA